MTTFLYIVWIAVPLLFLFIGLWSASELFFGKKKTERPGEYFVNAFFTTLATLLAIGIDTYLLPVFSLPREATMVIQIGLYPAILYFGAIVAGPSRQILIGKLGIAARRR